MLATYTVSEEVTTGTAANGDIVNIDFVGSIDGVEFEGGSTQGAGYELTLTKLIADNVYVPVIASGGGGTVEHMADVLTKANADAALIATMVHSGKHTVSSIKEELLEKGIPVRANY